MISLSTFSLDNFRKKDDFCESNPHHVNDLFEDIRPYDDAQVDAALDRLLREPAAFQLCRYLFPDKTNEDLIRLARQTHTVWDLQRTFSYTAITGIINRTITEFTSSGFDQLNEDDGGSLFISNHRDIVLDSAILNVILVDHGQPTVETGTGDNLFLSQVITDLLKLNRSFVVHRPEQVRELYRVSQRLSKYILDRREKGTSLWIAQRSGRTKDGIDRTETGLLKMFAMADKDFVSLFTKLKIRPLAISYEYDPCDAMKVQERYDKQEKGVVKRRKKDDFKAMLSGVTDKKGKTHFALSEAISNEELEELVAIKDKNERFRVFRSMLDKAIINQYRLFPIHFAAADWQRSEQQYVAHYTSSEKTAFESYVSEVVGGLEGDTDILTQMMLDIYAGPVKSKEALGTGL